MTSRHSLGLRRALRRLALRRRAVRRAERRAVAAVAGVSALALISCGLSSDTNNKHSATALSAGLQARVWAASGGATERVVVVGDSLSTGHGTAAQDSWPSLISADELMAGDRTLIVVNAAQDGTGYVNPGDDGEDFAAQAASWVTPDTQVVLFFGSENDVGFDPDDVRRAAEAAYAEAKARAPQAAIIAVGPPAYTEDPDPGLVEVRDQLKAAAAAAGTVFVDPIAEHWILDDANGLLGSDGDHPSLAGQYYLKERMAQLLEAAPEL
jgi:acyl-CoA thioesterase I